ncbi:hypothetical protein OG785_45785 [Streptomyces sp. NBC_00006]|uniref:hypothetical protein n=1 Tax=Streptomyces sp. NBC_00006 TaxID=2975619 RepID=UPI002254D708|nr:hypothetical protein [Streptomyces sp. NBC_00006]MCX5537716.1 hypothetical protein [Streptomyces sp. NBC_00006]MCX5537873.1 hypothetical protein [Streptomyces sp. NBC_00006]
MAIPGNFLSSTTETIDPNTSGWAPKLNCTLQLGSGGRVGSGSLMVRATATGEAQARTVTAYPVVVGNVYQTFADTGGTSAERIGIRWLSATGAEISITWSVVTMAGSLTWHRVGVAGPAPAGAVTAQVVCSSTEAAGAFHYWESIYFGLPIRTTGNLFGFGTESSEIDASGWTPLVNATISRQVPVVQWATDFYLAGGHMLAMTATAAGNAAVAAVDRPGVTPGVEYLAYTYLQPPTLSSTAWIELRFYDSNNNQIKATRAPLAQPGTGMYRQRVSDTAPSNAATASVAVGLDGASAGQVLRVETVVVTAVAQFPAGTVVPYSDASFEQGIGQWTTASGVATRARTTPWGTGLDASYAMAVTSATATASVIRSGRYPLTGGSTGQNWRALISVKAAAGAWSAVGVRIRWYDATNTDLGSSTAVPLALSGSDWWGFWQDATQPATATQAAIELTVTASAVNSVLYVDAASLWMVLPLTAVQAVDEGGYIALTLRELPLDYALSVYRQMSDGSRVLVRGAAGLLDRQTITSDLMVIEDHEAPLNTQVSYYIELRSPSGTLSTRTSSSATVTLADLNESWLKDPGNPQRNTRVVVQSPPDWQRPIEQSAYVVKNRRNKVTLSGKRQGLEGDLSVWTRSDEERRALHLLLDSGNTLFWQAVPGMGVDDMYVAVGAIDEGRIGNLAQEPWRAWKLPLVEADMPVTTGVNGAAGRTWQDVLAEFTTCADLLPVYATSEALLLDRRTG